MPTNKSPYLKGSNRLADVVRAIQVMGSYQWSSRKVEDWSKNLDSPSSADSWKVVFEDHPEFFRIRKNPDNAYWASLVWRRSYDKVYDPAQRRELNQSEIGQRPAGTSLTRRPLEGTQIEALLKAAIEMHSRAIAQQEEKRWWITVFTAVLAFVGGILGAILGAVLKAK